MTVETPFKTNTAIEPPLIENETIIYSIPPTPHFNCALGVENNTALFALLLTQWVETGVPVGTHPRASHDSPHP